LRVSSNQQSPKSQTISISQGAVKKSKSIQTKIFIFALSILLTLMKQQNYRYLYEYSKKIEIISDQAFLDQEELFDEKLGSETVVALSL
jgi:transposase